MKKQLTLVCTLLLVLVLTLTGCHRGPTGQTDSDPSGQSFASETVKIVCKGDEVVLGEDEAKTVRDALRSAAWEDTGPCDCVPLCVILVGETTYSFKNDHIEQGGKSTSDGYFVIEEIVQKHFSSSLTDEWDIPMVTIVANTVEEPEPIILEDEEAEQLISALSNLEWTDVDVACNCVPVLYILALDNEYALHPTGFVLKDTRRAYDKSGVIYEIINKYFPELEW